MELQQILSRLLLLAEEPSTARLSADDIRQWPASVCQAIKTAGLLQEEAPSKHIQCDECDGRNVGEVTYLPRGTVTKAYLACPSCGRVEIPFERLRQFSVYWRGFGVWLGNALNTQKNPTALVQERAWDLGRCSLGQVRVSVAIVRGLYWQDAAQVLGPTLTQLNRLLFTPSPVQHPPSWLPKEHRVVALADVMQFAEGKLSVNRNELAEIAQPSARTRTARSEGQGTYPLPLGCTFEQVQVELASDESVRIRLPNQRPREFDYKQIGLVDRRSGRKPSKKLWGTLEQFAVNNGVIDWGLSRGSTERQERLVKHIQRLKQVLQAFFETDQEPFLPYDTEKTYRCRFTITDARYGG